MVEEMHGEAPKELDNALSKFHEFLFQKVNERCLSAAVTTKIG
jgi:hypothetical protein